MERTIEVQEVKSVLQTLFEGLDSHNTISIRETWHPDAMLFVNGTELSIKSLSFLLSLPEHVHFTLDGIKHVDVHNVIASARVDYRLAVGVHSGFFNLVKANGKWLIANWVDHGVEEQD
jgi:hypothetical protein